MAARDSEGRREIEAAKKLLAAAQAQASSAKEMKAVADKNMDAAEKEVADAKKFLEEAEERWEVIEVDSDDESQENYGGGKHRKVSLDIVRRQVEQVTVVGCGIFEANGIYKRNGESGGAPQYTKMDDFAGKRTQFKISRSRNENHRTSDQPKFDWTITAVADKRYFYYFSECDDLRPPTSGWEVFPFRGVAPAPLLRLDYA